MNTRREFVVIGAASVAVPLYAAPSFFTPAEASLVEIVTGHIIPKDDTPGAIEAGVVHYIDRQLAGPLNRFAPLYREGLPAFEPLRQLDSSGQLSFLNEVEKGTRGASAARLFNVLIDHTMQGFYGSPAHGGNQDEVSWKMLGVQNVMGGHAH